MAVKKWKEVQKDLLYGENGGETKSIQYADKIGMGYVSCSPFRILIARLVAQAVNKNEEEKKA